MKQEKSPAGGRAGGGVTTVGDGFDASIIPQRATEHNPKIDVDELVKESLTLSDELDAERRKTVEEAERARVQKILLQEGSHDEGNAQCVVALYPGRFAFNTALGWLHYRSEIDPTVTNVTGVTGVFGFSL